MGAILGDSYREEQERLRNDPIIKKMAEELIEGLVSESHKMSEFVHEHSEHGGPFGTPRHEFMGAATKEYVKRGGLKHQTIGGPANAILAIVEQEMKS